MQFPQKSLTQLALKFHVRQHILEIAGHFGKARGDV